MSEDLILSTDKTQNEDQPESVILNQDKHYDLQTWIKFTNLKCIREYKTEELDAFKKPFLAGWKRELSIRAQLHSSGKRIVDVYYISPCNQTRLKSYIELGFYLKNDQESKLEPENFTFAKQPIYKFPEEMIKQVLKTAKQIKAEQIKQHCPAEQNGLISLPQLTPINESIRSTDNLINNSFDSNSLNNSVAEGRSKRKRTAPTRFDDEDYLEQTLTKKKLVKTPPITPSTTKITKSTLTPFSPKSLSKTLKDVEVNLKQHEINNSEDRESISSFKSSRSNKSAKSEQTKQQTDVQTDSNLNLNDEIIDTNSKDIDDGDSNLSNKQKDENSQDHLQNNQPNQQTDEIAPTATPTITTSKPKSKSKRKSAKSNANNDLSILENSLLMETYNTLGMSNLLQNGNFECEDNDLSDCEFVIDTKLNDDQPVPPCSLICAGRKGDFPNLLCSKCLCLFHPQCVKNGVFLKDTKQFVCPNCIQPEDQSNAHEDTDKLFEEPPDLDEKAIEAMALINQSTAKPVKDKSINQLNSKQSSKPTNSGLPKLNGNSEQTILKKKSQSSQQLPNQIRLPPQLVRNLSTHQSMPNIHPKKINNQPQHSLMNHNSSSLLNHQMNTMNTMNLNPMNLNLQQQRLMKQNQFNSQLFKKLNQYSFHQQNLINLRSSLTQLANGTHSNSSIASRQTHLDNMNKTLLSSQQLLESIKKHTTASTMNPSFFPNLNRDSTRLPDTSNNPIKYLNKPTTTTRKNSTIVQDENELKFVKYLNEHQNGLKQMINQYEALDKIFDYLTVPDLIQCKLVNSTFRRLANEKHHWKCLNLKGLAIKDWQYFASKIVYTNQAEELCLEGLRLSNKSQEKQDLNLEYDQWKNFRSCFKYFESLNKINFGKISIQNLDYLLNTRTDEFNPLFSLIELSIKNLYDENQSNESNLCSLNLLKTKINQFENLRCLRIESKQGISNDEDTINLLNNLSEALPKLRSLYLPSLKGFSIENFEFLTKLNQLECLEIGSCESWTLGDGSDTTSNRDDEQMESELNEEENRLNIGEDDEFMNENQENEYDNNQKQSSLTILQKKHEGAFKYLSQLRNLRKLYLTDVIIDEMSNQLPLVVEKMRNLESLGLGYVTVSPDATQTLNMLCNTLKNKLSNLKKFYIETDDPHTNRCAFDLLLKRLDNLEELVWKVHTQVEDDGVCQVPFIKERGIESDLENEDNLDLTVNNDCIEMVETCYLNDVLKQNLKKTKVFILPQ